MFSPTFFSRLLHFFGSFMISTSLINERISGVLNRTIVAGVELHQILLSHCIECGVLLSVQVVACTTFAHCFFINAGNVNSMTLINALSSLSGIFGIVTGCFISTVVDNFKALVKSHQFMFISLLFISGVIWPIEGQPSVLKAFTIFAPFSYPTKAVRSIAFKNASIENHDVQMAFLVLCAWITITFSITMALISRKK
jgi:ABC-type polysaccharide/polyol phosphate export permease